MLDAAPVDTIRTAKLMAAAVPALDGQAAALARDLARTAALRERSRARARGDRAGRQNLADEREASRN